MPYLKPFHRNYRPVKPGPNSGYSDWAYTVDEAFANNPEHYTRAFSIIQADLIKLFEYVEPCDLNSATYSFRVHELLMRTCIEIEANFKAILRENVYTPVYKSGPKQGELRLEKNWNINDFAKVNKSHRLSSYRAKIPYWKGSCNSRQPLANFASNGQLAWYQAYNGSKHDRLHQFESANLGHLMDAFTGLFILLSSQFKRSSFSTGGSSWGDSTDSYYGGEFGIGDFLMIEFPTDWPEDEMYDFDWAKLKETKVRFEQINFNNI